MKKPLLDMVVNLEELRFRLGEMPTGGGPVLELTGEVIRLAETLSAFICWVDGQSAGTAEPKAQPARYDNFSENLLRDNPTTPDTRESP